MKAPRRRWLVFPALALVALAALRLAPAEPLSARLAHSTAIYAQGGELLRLTLASDEQYRLWLPLDEMSPRLPEAVQLYEDRWFRWHPGVNPCGAVAQRCRHLRRRFASGRLDHHHAARAPPVWHRQPQRAGQAAADRRRAVAGGALLEARNPRGLSERGAIRRQHRGRRRGEPDLLSQARAGPDTARGADAGGDPAEPAPARRAPRTGPAAAIAERARRRARAAVAAVARPPSD